MNVIDVTPRPAAVSAVVRFLQRPFMSILGILFILTALKWGTLLFVVPQYETVIITRFGKIVRTIADRMPDQGQALHYRRLFCPVANQRSDALLQSAQ
jgi:regulator of protease activity HflC (stomatin/prohibitin superfamily)